MIAIRLGQETTGHEAEDLSGCPIEPLGIVNDADQRLLLGDVGEQRQHRQTDQEAIRRRRPAPESEHRLEGRALTDREPLHVFEQRAAQLMEPAEGQLHLAFDTHGLGHVTVVDPAGRVVQQGALADASLTAQHQHPAAASTRLRHDTIERPALALTAEQT